MAFQINDPEEIDWAYFWAKKLEAKKDRSKDWNKAAPNFGKSAKRDDYHTKLIERIDVNKEKTILDLGCGDGTITIPLAKRARSVTNEKAQKENIGNIKTIEEDLSKITIDNVGKHDIVVASRSLNGILNIKETIANINEIANKYVYITLFGPNNWKIEKEFYDSINKEYVEFPSHRYFFNILIDMGIYPNVESLNIGHEREYESIEDAMDNGKWRLDFLNDEEKEQLHIYLEDILEENKNGKLSNPNDKADWVLYWWKK
nr:class I SAM-dependent methyltransferase [uncultured Methanobrevibacter sp.]